MARVVIDTSTGVFCRIAWGIQKRIDNIEKYQNFLSGKVVPPEWKGVSREQVEKALEWERQCLADFLGNDAIRSIKKDFQRLQDMYLKEEQK